MQHWPTTEVASSSISHQKLTLSPSTQRPYNPLPPELSSIDAITTNTWWLILQDFDSITSFLHSQFKPPAAPLDGRKILPFPLLLNNGQMVNNDNLVLFSFLNHNFDCNKPQLLILDPASLELVDRGSHCPKLVHLHLHCYYLAIQLEYRIIRWPSRDFLTVFPTMVVPALLWRTQFLLLHSSPTWKHSSYSSTALQLYQPPHRYKG